MAVQRWAGRNPGAGINQIAVKRKWSLLSTPVTSIWGCQPTDIYIYEYKYKYKCVYIYTYLFIDIVHVFMI